MSYPFLISVLRTRSYTLWNVAVCSFASSLSMGGGRPWIFGLCLGLPLPLPVEWVRFKPIRLILACSALLLGITFNWVCGPTCSGQKVLGGRGEPDRLSRSKLSLAMSPGDPTTGGSEGGWMVL